MTQQTADPDVAQTPGSVERADRTSARARRRRTRRRAGLVSVLLGAGVLICFAWLAITGLLARHELQQVRSDVRIMRTQVDTGDLAAARSTAEHIAHHAARAHALTTGPVWAGAAALPGGDPLQTVRALTRDVDRVGTGALPELVSASTQLDPARLRLPDGRIDLARITAAAPALDRALANVTAAQRSIAAQPAHTWLSQVDAAREDLLGQLTAVQHTLTSADIAARVAPPMLGAQGVRRYFVAFQNEAEARGTGGIPGAFAILRADRGKLSFERFEPDTPLLYTPVNANFGNGYDSMFRGANTTSYYVNTNLSPHFPYAAQLWLAMWQKRSGEHLDGAVAVDPTVLSYLLKVTGPARMPNGTSVTAGNVVGLTQSSVYAMFPRRDQNAARKQYLLDLARAVSGKVLTTKGSVSGLVRAGAAAAGQRRLLVFSTEPATEQLLAETALSGEIPVTRAPYVGMSIVNDGGNKLDYYLDRSLTWQTSGCASPRSVTVTMRLRNNAPPSGLSSYVTARSDDRDYPVRVGDNREEISYYATSGAVMDSLSVNGRQASAEYAKDRGHPVFTFDAEVPRGRTTTIVLRLTEPASTAAPMVLRQPLVRPLSVEINDARCR
jgi:hypothetical protein